MSNSHADNSHGHGHHPALAHHFNSMEDQFEAAKFGMWLFLVTEVLMFGGLFIGYIVFRGLYPEMFAEAHKVLSVPMGALNTIVLITSSVTMLLGVTSAQRGERTKSVRFLWVTILLAACFLVVKYFEYSHKIHEGLLPGALFHNEHITHPKAPLFFSLYFMMTGLHGFHVVVGMCLIFWIIRRSKRNEFSPEFYTPVELVGFYWHFVDLVWIYLFPLMYLVP